MIKENTDKMHGTRMGATEIAALIKTEIRNGTFLFHEKLPAERRLADTYGVARGTVREALSRLEADKYVEVRAGSGTYIIHPEPQDSPSPIEEANPLELIDARFALEPHMCRLAVLNGRRQDFELLEDLCARMEASPDDPVKFSGLDTEFHLVLANSTGNRLLIWIIGQITSVRGQDEWRRMRHLTLNEGIIAQYNVQHRQIVNAIRTREPERAAKLMKEHLETARLSLTRAADT